MDPYRFDEGDTPLLISIPHAGTQLPPKLREQLTNEASALPDTDWHVDRLYDFAAGLGAGVLAATWSRYVIDLNRAPDGADLYPDAENTELCPATTFDRAPVWRADAEPDPGEVEDRLEAYWEPYHDKLERELARLADRFGYVLLYDAHSIRSRVPRFFDGELPVFNIGTGNGATAAPELAARVANEAAASGLSQVTDGRFAGGYIVRRHGAPVHDIHAIQMELAQRAYMDEAPPYTYRDDLAGSLRPHLRAVLEEMLDWGADTYG